MMVASVTAATTDAVPAGTEGSAAISRTPTAPLVMPTISTTTPAISGGNTGRSRRIKGASAISNRPAATVIPKTSGRPPAFAAASEGAR